MSFWEAPVDIGGTVSNALSQFKRSGERFSGST
jgi:hypothetical protein